MKNRKSAFSRIGFLPILLLTLFLFSSLIIGCYKNRDKYKGGGGQTYFQVIDLGSQIFELSLDIHESPEQLKSMDTVSRERFMIRTQFHQLFLSSSMSGDGMLFALTPAPPTCICKIDTAYTISLNDFDGDGIYPDTLNDKIFATTFSNSSYRENYHYPFIELLEYSLENSYQLVLSEPPHDSSAAHQFELIFAFDDGRIFRDTTKACVLEIE